MKFQKYDVMIVGAGAAGLYAALNLDERLKVLLLSKKESTLCSNTALAQGGIAAVLNSNSDSDNVEAHIKDTLKAGRYKNNTEHLRILIEHAADNIDELIRLGVDFDRNDDGTIALGLEGGHSHHRIAHHKDTTGYEIITVLNEKVKSLDNIDFRENAHLLKLEKSDGYFYAEVSGGEQQSYFTTEEKRLHYAAKVCILATGGIGQVYNYSTNSAISTGDGIQFAYNLGAEVQKMKYIQFHPTASKIKGATSPDSEAFLISEAVRGEGAYLLNKNKERFCDELATRDVVSKCIIDESKKQGSDEIYISLCHLDGEEMKLRFPMIYKTLLKSGYDFTKEDVPVYPCQHYLMGGVKVDDAGQSNVEGLYVVGESAFTGVHGANRLASNSLLELLVFSRRAAEHISNKAVYGIDIVSELDSDVFSYTIGDPVPPELRKEIKDIMQKSFFVLPDYEEAKAGLKQVTEIKERLEKGKFAVNPDFIEVKSMATVAFLILKEVVESDLTTV